MKKPWIVLPFLAACLHISIARPNTTIKDSLLDQLSRTTQTEARFTLLLSLYDQAYQENIYEAEKYILTALGLGAQNNNNHYLVSFYERLASLHEIQHADSRAYGYYLEARKIAETYNLFDELPYLNFKIGTSLYALNRFDAAIIFLEYAAAIANSQQQASIQHKANLYKAFCLYRSYHITTARQQLQVLEDTLEHSTDQGFRADFMFHLQQLYKDIHQYKESLQWNDKASSMFTLQKDQFSYLLCRIDKAATLLAAGKYNEAVYDYRQLLNQLLATGRYAWLQTVVLDSLSAYYQSINDQTLARYYKKKSEQLTDSLMLTIQPVKLSTINNEMQPDPKLQRSGQNTWQYLTALGLLLAMSIGCIIMYRRYKRIKRNIKKEKEAALKKARLLMEQEKQTTLQQAYELIEEEKELMMRYATERAVDEARAIIEKAREEARLLQAEVTTTNVLLANNKDYLQHLQEKLLSTETLDVKQLAREIKHNLGDNDYWADFLKKFNMIHSQVIDRIRKKHPSLTPNDLKLVSFVISGLSNKEIAGLFSVEPESVKKARYRLKKKLRLKEEENLNDYLQSIL